MALALGSTLFSLLAGGAGLALMYLTERMAGERRRRRRARGIRVGWMPLDPSVDEIKLRINCENLIDG